MDFLRVLADDLQALRAETKRKYPVVKEAVDKALETLPYLQKQYAALLSVETAPGPGHPLFQCESILRPFLLACNHTNASHKVLILALASIQRLVSWDAIEQNSVGSILRVLQIQAEKNTHGDVQVKLLQTLLQLVTLGYADKAALTGNATATATTNPVVTAQANAAQQPGESAANPDANDSSSALVGNEDLVMQALWICLHLHGGSSGANSLVGNTAAMTIRQVVSLAFGKVDCSPEAKRVGVLVFQELCFMCREESGVWLKRTATSSMTVALGVELLETILATHSKLFREDAEFHAVLKQHVSSLLQSALETGCADMRPTSLSSASSSMSISMITTTTTPPNLSTPFFPLLVRVMRLTSILLCNFSDVLPEECALIARALLEVVSTGAYHSPVAKSPSQPTASLAAETRGILPHMLAPATPSSASGASGSTGSANHVTWPVLLALEVLNRLASESAMLSAMAQYEDSVLSEIAQVVSSVVTTSPPSDFRLQSADTISMRSGLEFLNDQDAPPLQPFFAAIRVAVVFHSFLIASIFDLSRMLRPDDVKQSEILASKAVAVLAPFSVHTFHSTLRHSREVELVQLALKSYHVLATTASRLRAICASQGTSSAIDTTHRMEEVVLASLRALCVFAFPLPDGGKSASSKLAGGAGSVGSSGMSSGEHHADESADADNTGNDSGIVTITWREVHAMKALFSAAHVMEEELAEPEWCVLLNAFQLIVGLTDAKLKTGQHKLPTRTYRLNAFRVEDEDVEQQLVMLGNSIVELFRDALLLSSAALRRLTAALQIVCWDQLGLEHPRRQPNEADPAVATIADSTTTLETDLPQVSATHQLKTYENFLGVGLSGTGTFVPSFPLRMLTQLATNSKRCFEDVMQELLLLSTYEVRPPATIAQFPQLSQLQVFCADSMLRLMQNALLNTINSLSPTSKPDDDANSPSAPHIFDQEELFRPLSPLMRSDMKERALTGLLDLLNACGHLMNSGWPLVLAAIQESVELGDAKTQTVAFKCLRVIVDDLVAAMPRAYLPHCVQCIGRFACCAKDVNISLTAINELWSVADIVGKRNTSSAATTTSHWGCAFAALGQVALDDRAEVRNSAINTLFSAGVTYGVHFNLEEWQLFLDKTVLPLAETLYEGRMMLSSSPIEDEYTARDGLTSAQRQWDESRVLMLVGLSRVLQTNCACLLRDREWFTSVWRQILAHVVLNAEHGQSKEVVLAAVQTLQTLLQVASSRDFEQLAQAQPLRAGAGMRVVGGALVSMTSANAQTSRRSSQVAASAVCRDPVLWEEAFGELLRMCDARASHIGTATWREDDEQEIASAVVAAVMTLYASGKDVEFQDGRNVLRLLDLLEVLVQRHVGNLAATSNGSMRPRPKGVSTITTNSLQARVLSALEECGSACTAHLQVQTKTLDQLVQYVRQSDEPDVIFFTRHALMSLAKLYASVSLDARRARFDAVLTAVQPFLLDKRTALGNGKTDSGSMTAAQKAAGQQWKHALRVLLVLTSQGLAAVQLADGPWQRLLETITLFVDPHSGQFPAFVQNEEDEALVLSVLETLVDSIIALIGNAAGIPVASQAPHQYQALLEALMRLLSSGMDAPKYCNPLIRACVRQLATLGLQAQDTHLAALARKTLVQCCTSSLLTFATLEEDASRNDKPTDSAASIASAAAVIAARDRVVILLASACEVTLRPRSVLEMFAALCRCITSTDADVRRLIQRLLLNARLPEVYGEMDDGTAMNGAT